MCCYGQQQRPTKSIYERPIFTSLQTLSLFLSLFINLKTNICSLSAKRGDHFFFRPPQLFLINRYVYIHQFSCVSNHFFAMVFAKFYAKPALLNCKGMTLLYGIKKCKSNRTFWLRRNDTF